MKMWHSGTRPYTGTPAEVFRSKDEGDAWTPVNKGLTDLNIRSVLASGMTVYAAALGGGIFALKMKETHGRPSILD